MTYLLVNFSYEPRLVPFFANCRYPALFGLEEVGPDTCGIRWRRHLLVNYFYIFPTIFSVLFLILVQEIRHSSTSALDFSLHLAIVGFHASLAPN